MIKSVLRFTNSIGRFKALNCTNSLNWWSQARYTHKQYYPTIVPWKTQKGRIPVHTGGSSRGTILEYGAYGMRVRDKGRIFSGKQLEKAEARLKSLLPKGIRIFCRVTCNHPICIKGNTARMGRGKGEFSHWGARFAVGRVLFEIDGNISYDQAKRAFKKFFYYMPGKWEVIDRNASPVVGMSVMTEEIRQKLLALPAHKRPKNLDKPVTPSKKIESQKLEY